MANSNPEEQRVRLPSKHLELLERFCRSLDLTTYEFLIRPNDEFYELSKGLATVFRAHLTPEVVEAIIFREVMQCEIEFLGRTGRLASPENGDILKSLVDRLKAYFESIPRKYTLRIDLPHFVEFHGVLELAPDVRIVVEEPKTINKLLLLATTPSSAASPSIGARLEIETLGYGDSSPKSPAASACLSTAKQCAFMMTASGLCRRQLSITRGGAQFSDGEGQPFTKLQILESDAQLFTQLKIDDSRVVWYDWLEPGTPRGGLLLAQEGRPPENQAETARALNLAFSNVRRFFESRLNEDFAQIAAGIEWYMDSICADNDTFAYIAACVGLEAILGSEDEVLDSLTKRLSDRYAFLMGAGRQDRERLRKEYAEVLRLRGRLVHGKAARLAATERPLLLKAQKLLLDLVWKETGRIKPT